MRNRASAEVIHILILAEFAVIVTLLWALSKEYQSNKFMQAWIANNAWPAKYLLDGVLAFLLTSSLAGWTALFLRSLRKRKTSVESQGMTAPRMQKMDHRRSGPILRYFSYVKPHWRLAAIVAVSLIVTSALNLVQPWVIGFLLVGDVITQRNLGLLPWILTLLALAFVGKEITGLVNQYSTTALTQKTLHNIRSDLYHHLEQLPVRFFDNSRAGELASRVITDTDQMENVMTTIIGGIGKDLFTVVGAFILLLYVNSTLTLLVVPALATLAATVSVFKKTIRRSSRHIREAVGEMAAKVVETISGIRIVKSFSMEKFEAEQFQTRSSRIWKARVRLAKLSWLYSTTMDTTSTIAMLVVIAIAAPEVVSGSLALGGMVAFLGYVNILFNPIGNLSNANLNIQKATAAGERIFEIIDTQPEITEAPDAIEPSAVRGQIEFDKVSFGYEPDAEVLEEFSLKVQAGETVAIVGRSGVGKSTIVNLLLRFYEPTSGRILVDSQPIDSWKLTSLRDRIAVVPQDPILFSGSIRDNIAYGNIHASDSEIVEAARAANAHEFINSLKEELSSGAYGTEIGERGVKLSTGQRQRIAIARALLKNPSILILDEATSNVDSESEALIQDALKRLTGHRTTIIIAHRLSTIMNADKIVVIDEGGIAEVGTHEQLLAREGAYSRLYEAQLKTQPRIQMAGA